MTVAETREPLTPEAREIESLGFLAYLRLLERRARGKPRIGKNATMKQEIVTIGQDPYLAFPETDLSDIDREKPDRPNVRSRVIGLFGPYGALPLNTTEEVYRWVKKGDIAFVRFTDVFATRFQQLFFRSWSDARAITQFDHETGDHFLTYVGAVTGIGTPAFQNRDSVPDINKLAMTPLAMGRVKSPVRLQQMLRLDLKAHVSVEEHIPTWIMFEPDGQNRVGMRGSTLGRDLFLGARVQSVSEKIRLHIRTRTLAEYRAFLPGGPSHARLRDIVKWYLGQMFEVDVALTLPASEMRPAQLGKTTELGWMANLPAAVPPDPKSYVSGATYALSEAA
jgi:type VI secretion system protein ImpH